MTRALAGIAAVVALGIVHAVWVAMSFGGPDGTRLAHDVAGWAGSVLGVVGTVAAAATFARGDHLRRVWSLLALGSALLLVGTALRSHWTHVAPDRPFTESPLLPARMVVVTGANVASVWALVLLALTWRRSGLKPPLTWQAVALWGTSAAAALAIALPQYVIDFRRLGQSAADTCSAITSIASTMGDMMTVLLIAPILRVAYWLRGGRLSWAWWAMAISGAVWLVFDSREWIAQLLPGDAAWNLEMIRVTRSLGLSLVGLAGWLQREAVAAPSPNGAAFASSPAQSR